MAARTWQRLFGWSLALALLMGVFALYLQPHFMVQLAQQVWACF